MKRILAAVCVISFLMLQSRPVQGQGSDLGVAARSTQPLGDGTVQLTSAFVGDLTLRSLGPAIKPGRVADIAVDPRNHSLWYLASASGGLWKTTNCGIGWEPIFDEGGSYSLGCVTIDTRQPDIVWLGTGENSSNRSVGYGDGIYKSTDGGRTWTCMGLSDSQHIGRILVDPRDSDVVFAAAEGPLWSSGGERGVFKTTDGGRTWKAVLEISENTGITDMAFDARDPDVIYAAAYQRRRHVGLLIGGGPESAIYKTTDGGQTWKKLSNGLPAVDIGRIALAVSPQNPDVVYALVCAAGNESGFFRSADSGETWTRQSNYSVIDPQYYGEIYADPHQFDRVYAMDMTIHVTEDGGRNFERVPWSMHVDHHAMAFDPTDRNHLLVGNDGGLYESYDHGATWRHFTNLPTPQFYRVATDSALPFYHVYGGTQDNGSMGGPSRTVYRTGIRASEWIQTGGGDGFQPRIDPENTDIIYGLSQNGAAFRLDKSTGISKGIRPAQDPNDPVARWHWDTPLMISAHSHTRLYMAGNRLYRSEDRGDTWQPVSGDLTRQLDPDNQRLMGKTWGDDAVQKNRFTTSLSVSSALDESPLEEGLLYIGTDDGLVQASEDSGQTWRRTERFPGIPDRAYVSDICASQHDADTVYVALHNYQRGDFKPYLLQSHDRARTWTSIAGDLPARHGVWSVVEDHVNPNLLFAGTEFGLFFTVDGGQHWVQLRTGAPTIPFRDLALQRRENDLVAATFGRGFYVLDDYTPLRHLTPRTLAQEGSLFPPRDARVYNELGTVVAAFGNVTTPNPPFGATLHYYVREAITGNDHRIVLAITDAQGEPIRRLTGPAAAGLHRVVWDLRRSSQPQEQEGRQGRRRGRSGPLVEPGKYTITLLKVSDGQETRLGKPRTIRVKPL
ncbi:MAG: glycosyl hydrolase [Phycisphaerae bacterium]|nr:glycosyl hydrolase [Phycisphaerae bacterium]